MKIFLGIVAGFIILIFVGYKVVDYKFIKYQESEYELMGKSEFEESQRTFPDSIKIKDEVFWSLITSSKNKYPNDLNQQAEFLIDSLSKLSDQEIIGYECTFRENIIKLWDYNVKSLYQITENDNYISTDDFIYFRCYLVSLGKEAFEQALKTPDRFDIKIDRNYWSGEEMLYIADKAYEKKYGFINEEKSPRWMAKEVDYDFGSYKMTGVYIHPSNFKKHFPKLTKKY